MRQLEQGRARSAAGAEGWNYFLLSLKNTGMKNKFFKEFPYDEGQPWVA